jgi:hypothetical protein
LLSSADCFRRRDLFSEDDSWSAEADEPKELWPEVPFVGFAFLLAGVAEWLARTGAGPDFTALRPAGKIKGELPAADASEEVASLESNKVLCSYFTDAPFIDGCRWPEIAEPRSGESIMLVEEHRVHQTGIAFSGHRTTP